MLLLKQVCKSLIGPLVTLSELRTHFDETQHGKSKILSKHFEFSLV